MNGFRSVADQQAAVNTKVIRSKHLERIRDCSGNWTSIMVDRRFLHIFPCKKIDEER